MINLKILKQLAIIFFITFLGEAVSRLLHLPIPGNVIGMLLLLVALLTNILKTEAIEEVSNYLLNNLAFFFVPASIGILGCLDILKGSVIKILLVCIISTSLVLIVTAYTVQLLTKVLEKKNIIKEEQ
ncbi:CidA/LrgA family protein [Clostridium senegalense]